ncbi:chloride channel protein [Bacillus sp. 31A1R]|uniref:Chloride channel protein n=1 Tax=Robertmurraya mangrovi TaxID=3098077 RepID=A0ABU5IWJ0_9BACI|nr:chloride channel protein [Bacillus sp. 31A1R]MDZ5471501.1 chloride channel protein [Bacillus sp. 31A1R]
MTTIDKYKALFLTLIKWILLGSIIGLVVGTTTAFLLNTNDLLGSYREKNFWLIAFLPFGGILIGYLYMYHGKESGNHSSEGNNLVIEGVRGKARVLKRLGPLVYIGTFITILFGGSTGREGAAIQMGGSVAQTFNQFFKIGTIDKKILLMSGISSGFGAAFGTPITGTIFGMEMAAIGKVKSEAFIPCLVSSFVGHYVTVKIWGIKHEKFLIDSVPSLSISSFSKVLLLAVIFSFISVLYCQLRHGIQRESERILRKNHIFRAFIGGLIIAILTYFIGNQDYNGRGLHMLEESFNQDVPHFAFLGKLIFTAITLGMGFVGGEAIPLFYIGATLGNSLTDYFHLPLSFMAALGLIATFCAGANTPISAFTLALEMFQGKGLEFFFVACVTSYIFSGHHSLWPSQTIHEPKSRLYSLAKGETISQIEKQKNE